MCRGTSIVFKSAIETHVLEKWTLTTIHCHYVYWMRIYAENMNGKQGCLHPLIIT
jgi:hypothetical protein